MVLKSLSNHEAKGDSTSKMEPTTITGVFAGYELASGCRWSGIYMVWLERYLHVLVARRIYQYRFLIEESFSGEKTEEAT